MKTVTGIVKRAGNPKTVYVETASLWMHPIYRKAIRSTKTIACHNEGVKVAVGDTVIIRECKPMSATKRFIVVEVVKD